VKTHQRALQEWLENRIRFKTWFSTNTIHTNTVFDSLCRAHLRGGAVANKVLWYKACAFHDELLRVVRNLRRAGLPDDRIDTLLNGLFTAQNLLQCSNDKDVVAILDAKAVGWKQATKK
jgi:hypothetical protein